MTGLIARLWEAQWASYESVRPKHAWSEKEKCFYIDSKAGLLRFKPKSSKELTEFRSKVINEFETIVGTKDDQKLFEFYRRVRRDWKVSYKANLRTRLKGLWHVV